MAEAIRWHRYVSFHTAHLPRAGGLEEQDALLLEALTVLAAEARAIESATLRKR